MQKRYWKLRGRGRGREAKMTKPTKFYQHQGALYREALEGEQQDLGPDVTDKFRGFDLSVLPTLAKEALNEIQADPENFDTHDNGFEYYVEDLVVASGVPEHYAEALGIDLDDPEWLEAVEGQWEWEMIQDVEEEISGKIHDYMAHHDIPGSMFIGTNEGSGDYGILFFIGYDEAEENGVVVPSQGARW